jgi:hypothetical protein
MSNNIDQIDKLLKFNEKINAKLVFSQITATSQQHLLRLVGINIYYYILIFIRCCGAILWKC